MVPDTSTSRTAESPKETEETGTSTLVNALLGGVAGIVLSFVPLSPVLGGAVAGYLERGTNSDGLRVGALAGLVMLVPYVFIGLFVLTFFLGFGGPGGPPIAFGLMVAVVLVFSAVYTVGLSALGGVLGSYLRNEL